MVIKNSGKHDKYGYKPITQQHGLHSEMLLDFGLLNMRKGEKHLSAEDTERAFLLIRGKVTFVWEGKSVSAERKSCLDESPTVLHVPGGTEVLLQADDECEICVEGKDNENRFESRIYYPSDVRTDIFGGGTLGEASIRSVRTVFDGEINPLSNMVLGEVINHPGKWSSYPPHHHPQPEIYHYRLFPPQGFGISVLDDDAYVVKDGDTTLIPPGKTHSQGAAPGYAMYYIWMIPHLPDNRWVPSTRFYTKEHEWLLEKDVKIWPELKETGGR